jgi:sialidase-1
MAAGVEFAVLFRAGEGGYHTYRIPALLRTGSGVLLAFCEGRRDSPRDHGKIDMLLRRSDDDGRTWSPPRVVYADPTGQAITIGNPCPVFDQQRRRVLLAMTRDNRAVLLTASDDDGRRWCEPRDISDQAMQPHWDWVAAGPGVGIQLQRGAHAGRLLIPCDHRPTAVHPDANVSSSHAIYSDDGGASWRLSQPIAAGSNECQAAERRDGSVVMNMRMQALGQGCRGVSVSGDGGVSWSPLVHDRQLPEPICQASLIALAGAGASAPLWVFSNPAGARDQEPGSRARTHMTVRLSDDEGRTWPRRLLLHAGPAGYSALAQAGDGSLLCLFEAGEENYRETITLARFGSRESGDFPAALWRKI